MKSSNEKLLSRIFRRSYPRFSTNQNVKKMTYWYFSTSTLHTYLIHLFASWTILARKNTMVRPLASPYSRESRSGADIDRIGSTRILLVYL